MPKLNRLPPPDYRHVEKYPIRALATEERPEKVPVVIGIDWHANFDVPQKDDQGRWWIGRDRDLGRARGGHCVCLKPQGVLDLKGWWLYYNQGKEGACVGFGSSRMMTLLNRNRYDAFWLYRECKKRDGIPHIDGTYVHIALDILREVGHKKVRGRFPYRPKQEEGIFANRWAANMDEVLKALGMPGANAIPILNSWGPNYPHLVWMPAETAAKLIFERGGEAAIIADR